MISQLASLFREAFSFTARNLGWINLLRGITIIMVVYRHSTEGLKNAGLFTGNNLLQQFNDLMHSFRMPLFFVVAGILMNMSLSKRCLKDYLRQRVDLILYPYVIWATIQTSIQLVLPDNFTNAEKDWRSYLEILYAPRSIEQFWYLYALFNIMVIYSILKVRFRVKPLPHFVLSLAMLLIEKSCRLHNIDLYFVGDIFAHYIYFATGDIISGYVLNPANRNRLASKKTLMLIIPFFIILNYLYVKFPAMQLTSFSLLVAYSGIALTIVVSFMLENVNGVHFLKVIGANSLYIYLMHVIIMGANRVFMTKVFNIESVAFLTATNLLAGLILPVLIHNILVKNGVWWLFTPSKPKEIATPRLTN